MKIKLTEIPCFYINKDSDIDKSNKTMKILEGLGFKNITRVSAILGDGKYSHGLGCAKSHLQIMNSVKEYPFIIFEDDIDVKSFVDEIDIPDNAEALYLGNYLHNANSVYADLGGLYATLTNRKYPPLEDIQWFDQVFKVRDMLATHAILYISKDFVAKASEAVAEGLTKERLVPIDVTLAKMQFSRNIYVVKDPMFWQNNSRDLVSGIRTIFPTYEIGNIMKHYPGNFELIANLASEEMNKLADRLVL